MLTPQFLNVGADKALPLESLKPVGTDIDTDGGIYIETLTAGGTMDQMYQWIDWGEGDTVGWCDDSYTVVEGVKFAPGQGLWVGGTTVDSAIQSSGQVSSADIVVQLRSGFTATGNPLPVSVALQDIIPEGDGIDTDGGIYIETLTAGGTMDQMYQWIDWGEGDTVGWCDDSYTVVEGVKFAPGQGLWVGGTGSHESLRFPAPEL